MEESISVNKEQDASKALVFGLLFAPVMTMMTATYFPFLMYAAWCDVHIWNWFVAPYLHLGMMPFWIAFGLILWIHAVMPKADVPKETKWTWYMDYVRVLISHTMYLAMAFAAHHFGRF